MDSGGSLENCTLFLAFSCSPAMGRGTSWTSGTSSSGTVLIRGATGDWSAEEGSLNLGARRLGDLDGFWNLLDEAGGVCLSGDEFLGEPEEGRVEEVRVGPFCGRFCCSWSGWSLDLVESGSSVTWA